MNTLTLDTNPAGEIIHLKIINYSGPTHLKVPTTHLLEIDARMSSSLTFKLDGQPLEIQQPKPSVPVWCNHIQANSEGRYCYNGMDITQWLHCPKCGASRPLPSGPDKADDKAEYISIQSAYDPNPQEQSQYVRLTSNDVPHNTYISARWDDGHGGFRYARAYYINRGAGCVHHWSRCDRSPRDSGFTLVPCERPDAWVPGSERSTIAK